MPGCAEDQCQQGHGGAGQVFKNSHARGVPWVHGGLLENVLGEVQGPRHVWTGKYRHQPGQA